MMEQATQPASDFITIRDAARLMRVTVRTVWRSGLTMQKVNGRTMVWTGSLPERAQSRLRDEKWRELSMSQPSLFRETETEADRQIASGRLTHPASEVDFAVRRYRNVELLLNHDWKARGYASKKAFMEKLAEGQGISIRTLERDTKTVREGGGVMDLARERPGPPRGTGSSLTDDVRAHLYSRFIIDGCTQAESIRSAQDYIKGKQRSPGCKVAVCYPDPEKAKSSMGRYLRSLNSLQQAFRDGPDAFRAACGYLDRTYRDLPSLGRVETDEWKLDFICYREGRPAVYERRFWLLTFYDERSSFPLVWKLVEGDKVEPRHGITAEDEIDLLVRLLLEYGVPGALVSDRGRFRGGTFGGTDRFKESDGILDRFGIPHLQPREKNPRGARLERFHRFLADKSRTVRSWIGANTEERKAAPGDALAELHKRFLEGDPAVPTSPLPSTTEAEALISAWIEEWRAHPSEGTDMDGLSPRAVFQHNIPPGGFRKPSEEEITLKTAEHFLRLKIRQGGIIQLPDGKRYSDPRLLLIQGQVREVARARHKHEQIAVLPAAKGEEVIFAQRRVRVGTNDPDQLSAHMEFQTKVRKLAGEVIVPREYQPEAEPLPAPPVDDPAPDHPYTSSVEYVMEGPPKKRPPRYFADLEE